MLISWSVDVVGQNDLQVEMITIIYFFDSESNSFDMVQVQVV